MSPPTERSGASEAALGTTKEVLGFIIEFLASNFDFLGFPIIVLGSHRISIRVLSGFYQDFDLILIRSDFDSILA